MNIEPEYAIVDVSSSEIFNYPFIHMTGHGNVYFNEDESQNLRKYLVSEDIERDEYIKNAPQSDDGYYLSPKVIDQK